MSYFSELLEWWRNWVSDKLAAAQSQRFLLERVLMVSRTERFPQFWAAGIFSEKLQPEGGNERLYQ